MEYVQYEGSRQLAAPTRPICISLLALSTTFLLYSFLPLSPSTLTKHMWQAAARSLDISVSYVPNRLYSYLGCVSLKLSASIRRWFFAFAGLTPIHAPHRPHVPPGNYGKQNKNSIFSALLQVFRSKLCPKNK